MARVGKKVDTGAAPEENGSVALAEASRVVRQDAPDLDQIRMRAYELFLERGRTHGHHVADWLRAESECRERWHDQPRSAELS